MTHTHTHSYTISATFPFLLYQESYLVSPSSPHMDLDEFEKRAEVIFKEYFDHGESHEVAASLEEFNIRNIKHEVATHTHTHTHTHTYSCM